MKKIYVLFISLVFCANTSFGQSNYIGEIKPVAITFTQAGWAECNGQLLPIAQNAALFSIIGTTYGGNGTTNFALPDLRGRAVIGKGTNTVYGQVQGTETVILTTANLPVHNHTTTIVVNNNLATSNVPVATGTLAIEQIIINSQSTNTLGYNNLTPNVQIQAGTTGAAGTATPTGVSTMQPFLTLKYVIATQGIFPSQN